jgi:hypothetical protein
MNGCSVTSLIVDAFYVARLLKERVVVVFGGVVRLKVWKARSFGFLRAVLHLREVDTTNTIPDHRAIFAFLTSADPPKGFQQDCIALGTCLHVIEWCESR